MRERERERALRNSFCTCESILLHVPKKFAIRYKAQYKRPISFPHIFKTSLSHTKKSLILSPSLSLLRKMASNKYNFSGKVALVTGSSSGLGRAIASQLAQFGAQVTITGRNGDALSELAAQFPSDRILSIVGDLSDESFPGKLIQETVRKFGRLDFLVNNAGAIEPDGYLKYASMLATFDAVFRVNVRSVVELIQLAVPELEKSGGGSVVNISSIGSTYPVSHFL